MKVAGSAGRVGRQRKQRQARLGLEPAGPRGGVWATGGVPRAPRDACQASRTSSLGLEPGPLLFPLYPTEACGARLPRVCPRPQQTRDRGLVCEQVTCKHSFAGGSQPTKEGPFRDMEALPHVAAARPRQRDGGPSQPSGVTTDPPRVLALCGQALLGPERPWEAVVGSRGSAGPVGAGRAPPPFTAAAGPCWTSG